MILQTGRSIEELNLRHALNATYAWLMIRRPQEVSTRQAVDEALSSEIAIGGDTAVNQLSEESIESLLDSF